MSGLRFRVWCLPLLVGLLLISVVGVAQAQPTVELAYDDGEPDEYVFGGQWAVKFSLPAGWTSAKILTAKYYITGFWGPSNDFKVHIYGSDGATELTPSFTVYPTATGWFDVDLAGLDIIVSGDFYVGIEYFYYYPGPFPQPRGPRLGIDYSGPPDLRTYYRSGASDAWILYWPPEGPIWDLCIRAVVQQVLPPEGVPEFGFSVPIVTSVSAALYLLIKQRLSNRKR